MDDGDVFLLNDAIFPQLAQLPGGGGIFGDDGHAAGFAVQAVDQMALRTQIKPHAADEAGEFAVFGGMADQAGGLVQDQQVGVFVDNVEQVQGIADCGKKAEG